MGIMKFISPYIFQAYLTCPREAWLEYHDIHSDQEHEFLALGRLMHEDSYKRDRKEIFVDQLLKIDLFKDQMVAEVKKSSRHINAAKMQLAYYLYYLKHNKGLKFKGVLLFPKERKKETITLTQELEEKIKNLLEEIKDTLTKDRPPKKKKIRFCKTCAFYEFCFGDEE
ncbi:MAG: CRISPR-associated protein Cas4 [Desulfonauticus sp.]|nr:CRISPR-associated protein Cas4 [Desulfonauticus sp.]